MRSSPITPTAQSPSTSSSSIALRMPCSGAENSQFFFASANVSPAPPAIARPTRLSCWALPMRSIAANAMGCSTVVPQAKRLPLSAISWAPDS